MSTTCWVPFNISRLTLSHITLAFKLSAEIIAASRACAGDLNNGRLSTAINRAKQNNLPKANIERAVELGVSGKDAAGEDATYEGIGPGNVGIIVQALTDNRNRTGGAVRHLFSKYGGSLQETGAQAWQFDRVGCLEVVYNPEVSETQDQGYDLLEKALHCGASDVLFGDEDSDDEDEAVFSITDVYENALSAESGGPSGEETNSQSVARVLCESTQLAALRSGLQAAGFPPQSAELVWEPKAGSALIVVDPESDEGKSLGSLLDALDDHSDVMRVFHNAK